jgi:hypothetical protein
MANQALFTPNRALDANAYAQPGATATFYEPGTTTLITVYQDDGVTVTTNPVAADGNGIFPQTWFNGEAKVVVRDADGATLWTMDPIPATSSDSAGAASISYPPSVNVPQTNVYTAIEYVATLSVSGFNAFGLGITGNTTILSNIDATGTASGTYRFTGTSTGTFPSGVSASTTGVVVIDRQTSAEATMVLRAAGASRMFWRPLAASTWGTWREVAILPTGGTALQQTRMNSGATALEYFTASGEGGPTTASGTAVNFSSIPANARRIVIFFNALSLSGTDSAVVQIGTGGVAETTGYSSIAGRIDNTVTATGTAAGGFLLNIANAANGLDGFCILEKEPGSNTWHFSVTAANMSLGLTIAAGRKALGGVLDFFRIVPSGANTFDAGTVSYRWEA